jgi:high-affinity Fe2+/Pb2+ permease
MLNLGTISAVTVGATLVTLSGTSNLAQVHYSESGSLMMFGVGLLVVSFVIRRTRRQS